MGSGQADLYGPIEMKERMGEIQRLRDATLDRLYKEVSAERAKVETALEAAKNPDLSHTAASDAGGVSRSLRNQSVRRVGQLLCTL